MGCSLAKSTELEYPFAQAGSRPYAAHAHGLNPSPPSPPLNNYLEGVSERGPPGDPNLCDDPVGLLVLRGSENKGKVRRRCELRMTETRRSLYALTECSVISDGRSYECFSSPQPSIHVFSVVLLLSVIVRVGLGLV